jgi:hypothetical protein
MQMISLRFFLMFLNDKMLQRYEICEICLDVSLLSCLDDR